jgi:DNA-binding Lrp family transcriptional regulator
LGEAKLPISDKFINCSCANQIMTENLDLIVLDKIDLNILSTLARNCRSSYSSIGSEVGLTSKSIKARVKKMIQQGVIEKFVVRVNPTSFGFKVVMILAKTSKGITKDDVIQRIKQIGNLAYHVHHMGRTCVAAVIIEKPLEDITIQSLNHRLRSESVVSITVLERRVESVNLSETDLRIIKCLLLLGARTEISDIAREVAISEKTTTRRLNRMKEANILDFSIQCSPAAMIGYIQFAIPIITTKFHRQSVLECMYSEFQANILYSTSVIDSDDRLTFVLYSENVFTVDYILNRVSSFEGVKNADVYILTKWQYHNDWIMKEISNKMSRLQPLLHRSIK